MYFPYLREKQGEVLAVRDATFLTDLTVPIFEPTRLTRANIKRWHQAIDAGRRLAFITNSDNGDPPAPADVANAIDDMPARAVFPAIEIRAGTSVALIQGFANRFRGRTCFIVHRRHRCTTTDLSRALKPLNSRRIVHAFVAHQASLELAEALSAERRVVLADGFAYATKNKDFPSDPQHYHGLLRTVDAGKYDGFGDFTVVGDTYRNPRGGGRSPYAVALHLTEMASLDIVINHFVSDPPHVPTSAEAKYLNALEKLVTHVQSRPGFQTSGVHRFLDSWTRVHYPNLWPPKQWSTLHHFEIIERAMQSRGLSAFV